MTCVRFLDKEEMDDIIGFKLYEANHPVNPFAISPGDLELAKHNLEKWILVIDLISKSKTFGTTVPKIVMNSVCNSLGGLTYGSIIPRVYSSVSSSVLNSLMPFIWESTTESVWDEVAEDVNPPRRHFIRALVRESLTAALYAYKGGLFPNFSNWSNLESLGNDPWRPLLDLWHSGYIPSFYGNTWRLHTGPKAEIVYSIYGSFPKCLEGCYINI